MDWLRNLGNWIADDRLLTHLVGIHVILAAILIVSVVLRKLIMHGSSRLVRWTGLHWLDGVRTEAVRHARALLFWATVGGMAVMAAIGVIYHFAGRDLRDDVHAWYSQLTAQEIFDFGITIAILAVIGVGMFFMMRLVRQGKRFLESYALNHLPHRCPLGSDRLGPDGKPYTDEEHRANHERTVKHWFHLLERFAIISVFLGGIWIAGHVIHAGAALDWLVAFSFRMLAIVMVARLLILACRTVAHALAELGNRHLSATRFTRYWERVTRLFPFGEKCFEAAVYITAASKTVDALDFLMDIYDPERKSHLGEHIVQCIGIFFLTRVVIELSTVVLNQAFSMYEDDRPSDQMGKTLVPLLQSICQYVLYFGSGLMILNVLDIPTQPILAGAGILGLGVGLGAQSLVTDIVSGFFILFENQYLVGDIVQVGDAQGRVEAVSIRHTQIRDEQGKLFIIPNGQIKTVINFSKGYVNAVVDIKVATNTPVDQAMRDMAEAGHRLRQSRREVLAETVVKGLIELTAGDMTIRAVTRVQPGTHLAMQYEYRRLLKEIFDQRQAKPSALAA